MASTRGAVCAKVVEMMETMVGISVGEVMGEITIGMVVLFSWREVGQKYINDMYWGGVALDGRREGGISGRVRTRRLLQVYDILTLKNAGK